MIKYSDNYWSINLHFERLNEIQCIKSTVQCSVTLMDSAFMGNVTTLDTSSILSLIPL